jgi:DNA polymerase-1
MYRRLVFDIEANGLLDTVTRTWVVSCRDIDTGERFTYKLDDCGWKTVMTEASEIIGHHIFGYDLIVLKRLHDWSPRPGTKVTDTLLMSQVLNYNRSGGHSLEAWGTKLEHPKVQCDEWETFHPLIIERCESDVDLTLLVFNKLSDDLRVIASKNRLISTHIEVEHAAAEWSMLAEIDGWDFDREAALGLLDNLESRMGAIYPLLSDKLGTKTVAVDREKGGVPHKTPKWTKVGFYDVHTARWFDIHPASGFEGEERLVEGPYSRVAFEKLSLNSPSDVRIFLNRVNWTPTEWNYVVKDGKRVRSSGKITEDSLEFLGGDGLLYKEYVVLRARAGLLKGWIEKSESGKIHGSCRTIGTPSFRATHSVIVNVPSVDTEYGPEIRRLFKVPEGYKLVGCDSSGNQARGLAHLLNDPEYTDVLLNGDIHSVNSSKMTAIGRSLLNSAEFEVSRKASKRILYAFLFGGSGEKLWAYATGTQNKKLGSRFKEAFTDSVPGLKKLVDRYDSIFRRTAHTGEPYIPSITGVPIFVDSPHKTLVYSLQCIEKLTCAAAIMLSMREMRANGINFYPRIFMHDEIQFMTSVDDAEAAGEICKRNFAEGPKLFGINIMDGSFKVGVNWEETH